MNNLRFKSTKTYWHKQPRSQGGAVYLRQNTKPCFSQQNTTKCCNKLIISTCLFTRKFVNSNQLPKTTTNHNNLTSGRLIPVIVFRTF